MTTLTEKDPEEIVPVTFNFSGLTSAPLSPTVEIAHYSGTNDDGNMAAMIVGSPVVSGANVIQRVGGGVAGATYSLRCEVVTAESLKYVLTANLPVRAAGLP